MKNNYLCFFPFILLCFMVTPSFSQNDMRTVTGTVQYENGEAIIGATVRVKDTNRGTVTSVGGAYSIMVAEGETLVYSFVGMIPVEQTLEDEQTIDVTLREDANQLDDVVVIGYGTQQKSDVTGAMVNVDSKELNDRPVTNVFEALQGKAAGVDITSNQRPGEIGSIRIRGSRSLTASNSPLYVVDGVPLMSSSAIETLNPRDIESIDILKDASATAIYGSRGANGVVIVTTKKGRAGQFSLNYTGTSTIQNINELSPMMDASEYITWRRWSYYNMDPQSFPRGDQPTIETDRLIFKADADPYAWENIMQGWEGGTWDGSQVQSTDWTDIVTQTAFTHEHTLSASGGSEKMNVYGSFGYLDNEGTQIGQAYQRYTANLSIDVSPKDWFSMGGSINAACTNQDYGMSRLGQATSSGPTSVYEAAQRVFAYAVPYNDQGERIILPGGDGNVYTVVNEWDYSHHERQLMRAIGSLYGEIDFGNVFSATEGLSYRINFGPDYRNWREGVYIDGESVSRLGGTSFARRNNQRDFSWTLDNQLNYNREFNDHSLSTTLLQTSSSWNIESSGMSAENIPKPSFLWNAFGTVDITDPNTNAGFGSGLNERQLQSYMGRVNYGFDDRYLLTLTGRWDGASQLAEGNKWAFFPSAAVAWRMEQEDFLQNSDWVDQLKLRFGLGSTGNSAISPYSTKGAIQGFFVPFGGDQNLQAYTTYEPNYTRDVAILANQDLKWERTTQYNLGVDFSLISGRLGGTIDAYRSNTDDLLMSTNIPTLTGYPRTLANVGETKNKGIDITLNTVNVSTADFIWQSNISTAWQKNEIVSLAYGENDMIDNGWFIGENINVIYGIANDGIWSEDEISEIEKFNENGHDFAVGKAKPVDQDGNYVINANDRVIIGNETPRWTLGFSNSLTYKGFELSGLLYGRLGYDISTGGEYQGGRYNQRNIDYWTPDNRDAEYQLPIYNEAGGDAYSSTLGYFSGSFIKIRNISLGYNLPQNLVDKLGMQNLQVYSQALNPGFIYQSVDFLDLDVGQSNFNQGFIFGLNAGF